MWVEGPVGFHGRGPFCSQYRGAARCWGGCGHFQNEPGSPPSLAGADFSPASVPASEACSSEIGSGERDVASLFSFTSVHVAQGLAILEDLRPRCRDLQQRGSHQLDRNGERFLRRVTKFPVLPGVLLSTPTASVGRSCSATRRTARWLGLAFPDALPALLDSALIWSVGIYRMGASQT